MLPTAPKQRFAFVSTMSGYPWGGSEELWSQTARELLNRGADVVSRTPWWAKEPAGIKQLRESGGSVAFEQPPRFGETLFSRILNRPKRFRLRRWLLSNKPDLVVISQGAFRDGVEVAAETRYSGVRYCLISQAAAEFAWPSDGKRADLCNAYQNAEACFFVSQANLQAVTDICGFDLPKAQVVRNPFNVDYDVSPPWPAPNPALSLACVARLDPAAKGQDILIKVLAAEKWRKREINLNLYGSGPMEQGLKDLVAHLGLRNLKFNGHIRDIAEVWAHHQALVLPSRFEGLPLALVEAMLCGRPSIVTDVAGNTEVVEDGVTGFVAPAPTLKLLDGALERAWMNRDLFQTMGERAAKRIRELVPRDPVAQFAEKLEELARP